jgi:predicted AAA+ superfamily ATPase
MRMLERAAYLDKIKGIKNDSCIKMITGIRHSGKSFLFYQVISELKLSGIDDEHIIHLNFESAVFDVPRTAREIEDFIKEKTGKSGKYYLFLDEIQRVSGWEKAVNALRQRRELDIYISMSDAAAMLKTMSQREKKYIVINFKPFSFSEYKRIFAPEAKPGSGLLNRAMAVKNSACNHFSNYMRYGGFPAVYTGLYDSYAGLSGVNDEDIETMATRLDGIYSSILLHDVILLAKIRNIELLKHIIDIIFLNIGKENSANNITEILRKKHYTKNLSLVPVYLKALENAFVVKKILCCNILTGKLLHTGARYFIGDHALLNAVMGIRDDSVPACILENALVHDLERREYTVYTGKLGGRRIDFVAKRGADFVLVQTINANADNETILEQKAEALAFLNDDEKMSLQKKYVIFIDVDASSRLETGAITGVHYISLQDFLLLETI